MKTHTRFKNYAWISFCVLLPLFFQSCASRNQVFEDIDQLVQDQEFSKARAKIQEEKDFIYPEKDIILYHLDDGMLALYENDKKSSLEHLKKAEDLMVQAQTKSITQEALSFVLNDTVIEYRGRDYEQLFTNIFLSINYLENNNFDAGYVELRRAQNIIQRIQNNNAIIYDSFNSSDDAYVKIEEYQLPLVDSALMRLFSSWLYRADADRSNYEVALRNYKNAVLVQPEIYDFLSTDFELENNFDESQQHPSIQVLAFTGRVPYQVEKRFSINSVGSGLLVSTTQEPSFDSFTSDHDSYSSVHDSYSSLFGNTKLLPLPNFGIPINASFALPELRVFMPTVDKIELIIENQSLGYLEKTESLENITVRFFESTKDLVYFKTISRVIAKTVLLGVASVEAKKQESILVSLLTDVGGFAFSQLSEKADLRNARYFPATIWTGDFLLEGYATGEEYQVTFQYYNTQGNVLYEETKPITIQKGFSVLNLLSSSFIQ